MSTWSVQCKSVCCRLVVRLAGITDTIIVRVDVQYAMDKQEWDAINRPQYVRRQWSQRQAITPAPHALP